MIDPGALGTLIIGLRAADVELELEDRRAAVPQAAAKDHRSLAATLAGLLRAMADRLEPAPHEPRPAH